MQHEQSLIGRRIRRKTEAEELVSEKEKNAFYSAENFESFYVDVISWRERRERGGIYIISFINNLFQGLSHCTPPSLKDMLFANWFFHYVIAFSINFV